MLVSKVKTLSIFLAIGALCAGTLVHAATLELTNSTPPNNAVDISRTDTLTLQFSVALSAKSINADTITLQSPAGTQKVALSVSGTIISVRPLTPMLPWTVYTLNAKSLVGSGGEQLAAPIALVFQTRDATWQAPQLIDQMTAEQWNSVTATNAKGIRFVAWLQSNDSGAGDDIWAVRHVPGATSSGAVRIASFPENYISELNVFVDEDGNALVTWVGDRTPSPPTPWHLWANRFVVGSGSGSGWGTPQIIDGYAKRSGTNLHLVFDHAGNAFVLWQEYDCCAIHSLQSIVVALYTRVGGWGHPVHLDDSYSFLAGKIDIQVDNAGDAYATWSNLPTYFNPTSTLQVSHYKSSPGGFVWTPPQVIATESTMSSTGYQTLAVNPRGEAFLMWADDTGLKYARADTTGNWSTPILIDSTVTISPTQMVLLDDDEAFAVFVNGVKNFLPQKSLWSWTHPLLTDQNASSDPRIVVDLNGNALIAWTQSSGDINRIYAKRYRADRGWFGSAPIDSGNTLGAQLEELFLEPSGSAVAAWWQSNDSGATDIQAARFE